MNYVVILGLIVGVIKIPLDGWHTGKLSEALNCMSQACTHIVGSYFGISFLDNNWPDGFAFTQFSKWIKLCRPCMTTIHVTLPDGDSIINNNFDWLALDIELYLINS